MDLAEALVKRITELEDALIPFARHGYTMASSRIDLIAQGKGKSQAGGVWINTGEGSSVEGCEKAFFLAVDAIGRARTQAFMGYLFEQAVQATRAMEERDKAEATSH